MQRYYYKSTAPETVAIVEAYYQAKAEFQLQLDKLGKVFGGQVAPMHDITTHFAGGVKLSGHADIDVHWRRPDDWGFQSLRTAPKLPKGSTKEERAEYRAAHTALLEIWKANCPPRLNKNGYWEQLSINTGNLMLSGGVMFAHQSVAYFLLGFPISEADHAQAIADGKPSSGWVTGAVEILPSEYSAAADAKNASPAAWPRPCA